MVVLIVKIQRQSIIYIKILNQENSLERYIIKIIKVRDGITLPGEGHMAFIYIKAKFKVFDPKKIICLAQINDRDSFPGCQFLNIF